MNFHEMSPSVMVPVQGRIGQTSDTAGDSKSTGGFQHMTG